jgi:hypothetical protein
MRLLLLLLPLSLFAQTGKPTCPPSPLPQFVTWYFAANSTTAQYGCVQIAAPLSMLVNGPMAVISAPPPIQGPPGPAGPPGAGISGVLPPPAVSLANPTTIQAGANCSVAAPCALALGSVVYSFVGPVQWTLNAPGIGIVLPGTVLVYLNSAGLLAIGDGAANGPAVACVTPSPTSCTVEATTQFPVDSIPLAKWNVTVPGTFDANGLVPMLAIMGPRSIVPGLGVQIQQAGSTVSITTAPVQ